jgi:5-oxoprolinase (ATP-hydrolysing)
MQSNGGLVDANRFKGKDAIFSGPAGGIVGAARVGIQAGFERIIAFDMGGTSTDVTHFAGEFERRLETEIAGVRICAPMMQIHTVAAGGGSICRFDGSRLRVGPETRILWESVSNRYQQKSEMFLLNRLRADA